MAGVRAREKKPARGPIDDERTSPIVPLRPLGLPGETGCERHRRKHWRGGQRYQRSYDAGSQEVRRRLLATVTPETRYGLCGHPRIEGDPWQTDHIIPASRGGASTRNNLQIVHASCNRRRGSKLGAERSAERRRAKPQEPEPSPLRSEEGS